MFGYCGTLESDVRELYSGLKRACANDPTLPAIAPNCSRHCHGWGYVIHADNGLFHYRTSRSIYDDDDFVLPKLKGEIRAIFHGRFAGDPELAGHIFSHPFMVADDTRVTFLAHNGGVEPGNQTERKVDSEWALEQIIRSGDIALALPKLKDHTVSALNLLMLAIGREKGTPVRLRYFHYFKPKEPDKARYYQMYEGTMPGGCALVSSTLTMEGAKINGLASISPASFDALSDLEA
jgi:predicted glutamine amidotransferase